MWPGSLLYPRDSAATSVSTFFPQEAESLSPYTPYPEGQVAGEKPGRPWAFLVHAVRLSSMGAWVRDQMEAKGLWLCCVTLGKSLLFSGPQFPPW